MDMKRIFFVFISVIILSAFFELSDCSAGDILPYDLAKPVPETTKTADKNMALSCCGKTPNVGPIVDSYVRLADSELCNIDSAEVNVQDYTALINEINMQDLTVPPSILGAVKVAFDQKNIVLWVCVPLIEFVPPGTDLEILKPNLTGSAWAATELTAKVCADGFCARFKVDHPGSYAVYNPQRKTYRQNRTNNTKSIPSESEDQTDASWAAYSEKRLSGKTRDSGTPSFQSSEEWGLHSENSPSPEKIPLILVHGDNSYKEKKDRWDNFLNWVSDHSGFDEKYEIWRFHHDTRELIGFDGQSGNAAELGDAIIEQFGPVSPILLLVHSRGGLVARSYMSRYGDGRQGDRVLGLVTLATPHHGSPGAVPDWGLETIDGKFRDTDLASILYGATGDAVVNVADIGTMGLAWDNFDGPDNGIKYKVFSIESDLGNDHVLSEMDTNLKNPDAAAFGNDSTVYIPDRSFGTLEELNTDHRHFHKIIAYGGYDQDLGLGGSDVFNWLNFSFADHAGLEMATHVMADISSKTPDGNSTVLNYVANDGMVPLQSAFLLKKDTDNEPMYKVNKENEWYTPESYAVILKDFRSRMNFRKAVICPDYDHLHMIEGRGGLLHDKTDYWNHVASSINELADMVLDSSPTFTPEVVELDDSLPSISSVASGDNCFIRSVTKIDK
jgi:pimeloyl-ACP methyl ester carboxylesterase